MVNRDVLLVVLGLTVWVGVGFLMPMTSDDTSTASSEAFEKLISDIVSRSNGSVSAYHEMFFEAYVNRFPEWATSLRMFGDQPDPGGAQLNDLSLQKQREDFDFAKEGLAQLRTFDRASQTENELLTTDILAWYLEDIVGRESFHFRDFQFLPIATISSGLSDFMMNQHTVVSNQDAENYISRLNNVETKFDQLIEMLVYQEEQGIIPPRFALERVQGGLSQHNGNPLDNVLYTSFVEKLEQLATISDDEKQQLKAEAADAIRTKVRPAFTKLRNYIGSLSQKAEDIGGLWHQPDGDAYYVSALRHHTTTDLTPEEIHQLGLVEVERIQNEMRPIFAELGLDHENQDFGKVMRDFWALAEATQGSQYQNTDIGRQRALADYIEIVNEAEEEVAFLFNRMPSVPLQIEASFGTFYTPPSLDGTIPGTFFISLTQPRPLWKVRTLAYHEAIPGHHLHLGLQVELNLSTIQSAIIFTGHTEGWGLYAERLAREIGLFPDPYSTVENLWWELLRAGRLVVDTGIHHKRWTREEGKDYYDQNLGSPLGHEIDRYIMRPAQATAYKVGELKILELKERVRNALGERFDIKTFHDLMLGFGQMPLNLLEQQVDAFIQRESQ